MTQIGKLAGLAIASQARQIGTLAGTANRDVMRQILLHPSTGPDQLTNLLNEPNWVEFLSERENLEEKWYNVQLQMISDKDPRWDLVLDLDDLLSRMYRIGVPGMGFRRYLSTDVEVVHAAKAGHHPAMECCLRLGVSVENASRAFVELVDNNDMAGLLVALQLETRPAAWIKPMQQAVRLIRREMLQLIPPLDVPLVSYAAASGNLEWFTEQLSRHERFAEQLSRHAPAAWRTSEGAREAAAGDNPEIFNYYLEWYRQSVERGSPEAELVWKAAANHGSERIMSLLLEDDSLLDKSNMYDLLLRAIWDDHPSIARLTLPWLSRFNMLIGAINAMEQHRGAIMNMLLEPLLPDITPEESDELITQAMNYDHWQLVGALLPVSQLDLLQLVTSMIEDSMAERPMELYHLVGEKVWNETFRDRASEYLDWLAAMQGEADQIANPELLPPNVVTATVHRGSTSVIRRLTEDQLLNPDLLETAMDLGYTDIVALLPGISPYTIYRGNSYQATARLLLPRASRAEDDAWLVKEIANTLKMHALDVVEYATAQLLKLQNICPQGLTAAAP